MTTRALNGVWLGVGLLVGAGAMLLFRPDPAPPRTAYVALRTASSTHDSGSDSTRDVVDGGMHVSVEVPPPLVPGIGEAEPATMPDGVELQRRALERHFAAPVNYAWARDMNWAVDEAMVSAAPRLGARAGAADCRETTCSVELTWPDHAAAYASFALAAEHDYGGLPCGRSMAINPDDGRDGPVRATLLFECER